MSVKSVVVSYPNSYNSKLYEFKTDLDLKTGDWVVVHDVNGYSVVKVEGRSDIATSKATKWVVSKVDVEAHEERLAKEKRVKEVKTKLEARRKKLEEIQVYRILAQEDAEMADLLKELESLN